MSDATRQVMTVRGPVDVSALGHCQIHEHIFLRESPMTAKNPALRMDDFGASLAELRMYKALGGDFLADAQPVGAGRDALVLERLSRESGVRIAACTGYHLGGYYPRDSFIHGLCEDGLYALFLGELERGMLPCGAEALNARATGVRAGMVKAAIPACGPAGRTAVLLRAAARAAAAAGVPLMLHTEAGQNAAAALGVCLDAGMKPRKVVICHMDRRAGDCAPHLEMAKAGVYLDYDTVGRFKYHSDEDEAALIRRMADAGCAESLLLSLDTTAERLKAYGGGIGLGYLLSDFLPMLMRGGLRREAEELFCRENCRRLFS